MVLEDTKTTIDDILDIDDFLDVIRKARNYEPNISATWMYVVYKNVGEEYDLQRMPGDNKYLRHETQMKIVVDTCKEIIDGGCYYE